MTPKVGLVCYGPIPTGLGTLARWFWKNLPLDAWLVMRHPKLGFGEELSDPRITYSDGGPAEPWVEDLDVILCLERPFLECSPGGTVAYAKQLGKRVVCVVMPEWTPAGLPWLPLVDRFLTFTRQGELHCRSIGLGERTVRLQCPLDLTEFPYRQRTKIESVVYCDGWGGAHERKGWPEVQEAIRLGADIRVKSLRKGSGTATAADLYADADCVVIPGRFDGVGLTLLEALASGCVVLASDAEPYREFLMAAYGDWAQASFLLPVGQHARVRIWSHDWPAAIVDPQGLAVRVADILRHGKTAIAGISAVGRAYIEREHGASAWRTLWEAICG